MVKVKPSAGSHVKPIETPATGGSKPTTKTKGKAAAKTTAKGPVDGFDGLGPVSTVRKSSLGAEIAKAAGDTISSSFPLGDLGKIVTDGTWGAGFRLDGGSMRLMWMNVRRVESSDGKPGFELFFFAHGKAVDLFRERMTEKGATNKKMAFSKSELAPDTDLGKSTMKMTSETWSPSKGNALVYESEGKFKVEMTGKEPEALKGAMRITTYGNDAEAGKVLDDVISELGLQAMFAPPTPKSLDRFKYMRFAWQCAPEIIPGLTLRPISDIDKKGVNKALEDAGVAKDDADLKEVTKAKLSEPDVTRRLALAQLLHDKAPQAFVDWAASDTSSKHGILPGGDDTKLNAALTKAGVGPDTDAFKEAEKAPLKDPIGASVMLRFGLLAKKDKAAANKLLERSIEDVPPKELRAKLIEAGYSEERLDGLKFEEVYPGYFTVLDPALSEELADEGARYLYSTSDNADRVLLMLNGGQKSSFTRFQEGMLIKGKSSDADFNTGGAFSVFSRLVTASSIKSGTAFRDWGGSRPYKLIINRRILDRLDWYAYNGDNYGRSTGLTTANKGKDIVRTIDKSYSTSNEVMFPVGNDSAYVDFVVCKSESERTKLIEVMKNAGHTEFNGRPLEKFVRVEPKFFQHPQDITLVNAVRDALDGMSLNDLKKEVTESVQTSAEEGAKKAATEAVTSGSASLIAEAATEIAKTSATSEVKKSGSTKANTASEAIDKSAIGEVLAKALAEAWPEPLREAATTGVNGASKYKIQQAITKAAKSEADAATKEASKDAATAAKDKVVAEADKELSPHELKKLIRQAVKEAVDTPEFAEIGKAKVLELAPDPAKEAAQEPLKTGAKNKANSVAKTVVTDQVAKLFEDGAPKKIFEDLAVAISANEEEAAKEAALKAIESKLTNAVDSKLRAAAKEAAIEAAKASALDGAKETMRKAFEEKALEVAQAAIDSFAEEQEVTPTDEEKAEMLELAKEKAKTQADELAEAAVNSGATTLANTLTKKGGDADFIAELVTKGIEGADKAVQIAAAQEGALEAANELALKHLKDFATKGTTDDQTAIVDKISDEIVKELIGEIVAKEIETNAESMGKTAASSAATSHSTEAANSIDK